MLEAWPRCWTGYPERTSGPSSGCAVPAKEQPSRWTSFEVAQVELSVVAIEDLDRMILTHSLPADTRERVKRSLAVLEQFPRIGRQLEGRWSRFRFVLGPWRWLLIVYVYDSRTDVVSVLTIQDARSSLSATSG
jgi:hypothetical protein